MFDRIKALLPRIELLQKRVLVGNSVLYSEEQPWRVCSEKLVTHGSAKPDVSNALQTRTCFSTDFKRIERSVMKEIPNRADHDALRPLRVLRLEDRGHVHSRGCARKRAQPTGEQCQQPADRMASDSRCSRSRLSRRSARRRS